MTYLNVFSKAKLLSIAAVVFSLGLTAADVGMRKYTGNLIDALTAGAVPKGLWLILGVLAVFLIALNFILPYSRTRLTSRIQEQLYILLEDKALRGEQSALDDIDPGAAGTYFSSDIAGIIRYVNRIISKGLPDIFTFLFSGTVLCFINPWLGLAAVVSAILPVLLMFFMSKALVRVGERYQEVTQSINQKISNYFFNLELVKVNALEETADKENAGLLKGLLREKRRQAGWEAALSFPTMFSTFLTILLLAVIGGYFVLQGSMGVGQLFTAITLADYIVSPVMGFDSTISQIRRAKASFNRINRFLTLPEEKPTADAFQIDQTASPTALAISGLQFAYPKGKTVFDGADFRWEQGQLHAIVGENGAGKSTLLKLLSGVYLPQGGKIVLNGVSLPGHLTKEELREQLVIDTQQTVLFPGTVRYNLTRDLAVSEEQLEAACQAAGIAEEIHKLSEGYDTLLGPGGTPLSGGQRQMIAIARAILSRRTILILDEAFAGVDREHIPQIIACLQNSPEIHSVIVVTHDQQAAACCDRQIIINNVIA